MFRLQLNQIWYGSCVTSEVFLAGGPGGGGGGCTWEVELLEEAEALLPPPLEDAALLAPPDIENCTSVLTTPADTGCLCGSTMAGGQALSGKTKARLRPAQSFCYKPCRDVDQW